MEFTNEELEELLTINIQAKTMVSTLSYCDKLEEKIYECMKNETELDKQSIKQAHNNYLALALFTNLNYCNEELFKKLNKFMDENR